MNARMAEQPVTIIMVEDDEGHARLIEKNIRRAGILNDIKHFTDGTQALEFLFDAPDGPAKNGPALVLLDLNLPDMSGTDILTRPAAETLFLGYAGYTQLLPRLLALPLRLLPVELYAAYLALAAAVVTALLDQVPREDPHRLAPQSLAVPRRRQVQVDVGAAVHRIVHLAVLHRADHLAVGLDHERVLIADELVHLAVLEDAPSPLDLRLAADRGEARRVGRGSVPEDETWAGELHRATA